MANGLLKEIKRHIDYDVKKPRRLDHIVIQKEILETPLPESARWHLKHIPYSKKG